MIGLIVFMYIQQWIHKNALKFNCDFLLFQIEEDVTSILSNLSNIIYTVDNRFT